jgi:hypothetical protein
MGHAARRESGGIVPTDASGNLHFREVSRMVLADFVHVLVNPKPVMERRLKQEQFFSMMAMLSLVSVVLAVASVSFFRAEDLSKTLGIKVEVDTYEAYKIFMLLGTGIVACFTPVMFVLLNTALNKLLLLLFKVRISFRQLFILGIFAYIPLQMDTLLRIIVQLFIGKPLLQSPARIFAFLTVSDTPLMKMLSVFTVFGVWSMLLYAFGVYLLAAENVRRRSVLVVVAAWIVSTIVSGYVSGLSGPAGT